MDFCPCPRECPRHGNCQACREHHQGKRRPLLLSKEAQE